MFPGGGAVPLRDRIITIRSGVIVDIMPANGLRAENKSPPVRHFDIIAPGFIDLQINGAGGVMFNDTPDTATLARMVAAARSGGTCHMLPTFITAPGTAYTAALDAVAAWDGPEIPGVHLEGPFLSSAKPGIHPREAIRRMNDGDVAILVAFAKSFAGRLLLTLAPEEVDPAHLETLHAAGIILFAGHSQATGSEIAKAAERGLCGVTHLFNACSQITARDPGVAGMALTDCRLVAGIIADGHHVDPVNLALAARMMKGRLCLVSDTMPTFGGAHLGLDEAVRMMVSQAGISLEAALDMASGVPADILGLQDRYGRIEVGRPASLTCLDESLATQAVLVDGEMSGGEGGDTGA